MKSRKRDYKINWIALATLFIGYLLTTGTGFIDSDLLKTITRTTCLTLLLINITLNKSISTWNFIALLIISIVSISIQSPLAVNLIFFTIILESTRMLNQKDAARLIFNATSFIVAIHIFLLVTGKISDSTIELSERSRNALGFNNPNQASAIYLSLTFSAYVCMISYRDRKSQIIFLCTLILSFYITSKTDSRTSLFSLTLLLILISSNKIFGKSKLYNYSIRLLAFMAPFIGIIGTFIIINLVDTRADLILSFRPYFFSEFVNQNTLWDFILGWYNFNDPGVDNLYLTLLSATGLFIFSFLVVVSAVRSYKLTAEKSIILIIISIASIFESFLIRPEIPLSIIFVLLIFSSRFNYTELRKI